MRGEKENFVLIDGSMRKEIFAPGEILIRGRKIEDKQILES